MFMQLSPNYGQVGMHVERIEVSKLRENPLNPRKDLGDLTELRESIRKNGILQNLTVMRNHKTKGYDILLGHRRFAAAKAEQFEFVPCRVLEQLP